MATTVLTVTITGIAADTAMVGGKGSKSGRRLIAVAAMLAGALLGAVCVLHIHTVYALVTALIILVIVGVTTRVLGKTHPSRAES